MLEFYNSSDNYDLIKNSVATVYLFYDKLNYKVYQEVPQLTPLGLFSNIGGVIGLLLGASLLSTVEIVMLGFDLGVYWVKTVYCRPKLSNKSSSLV
jgi:hypothetical protein